MKQEKLPYNGATRCGGLAIAPALHTSSAWHPTFFSRLLKESSREGAGALMTTAEIAALSRSISPGRKFFGQPLALGYLAFTEAWERTTSVHGIVLTL